MSGATAVRAILAASVTVTAAVPAAQQWDDDPPPENATLPLIEVDEVDSVPYGLIRADELPRLHTDRVQVTARTRGQFQGDGTYTGKAGCRSILALVDRACPSQRGSLGGIAVESITLDVMGPAIHEPADDTWSRARDLIVMWVES